MTTFTVKGYCTAEQNNELLEQGFNYMVEGGYSFTGQMDPRSGMPDYTTEKHFFTTKEEAEEYALTQRHPFNSALTAKVEEVEHRVTYAEAEAQRETERKAKSEKEKVRVAKKAAELGMTAEQYKEYKKVEAKRKRYMKEVAELEAELARKKAWLAQH